MFCERISKILEEARAQYAYPSAKVLVNEIGDQIFNGKFGFAFAPQTNGQTTSLILDREFFNLLWAPDRAEQARGLASIVYWGFYTFSDGYARNRVKNLITGPRGALLGTEKMFECLADAKEHVRNRRHGMALGSLGDIAQLSRTPFASKIIAFLDPQSAGVYDNRIQNFLALEDCRHPGPKNG
jgi:hypothetical protein